ncbi:YhaN family protein [Stieleria varia]|uniref:Chromosome segregation protein n=1 Tax=Stieleria varia TaxID=2528005 RepID=A0A5C6AW41_9BACT|nr:YhaN family protein [Stieleria varia]TWU02344.1 chromosome segregation protein [Stieleria varia]
MIIERLDLKAFGQFTDVSLDLSAGPRRFHLIYGPNESGKSTCMRAISSLLFGIPSRSTDDYLHDSVRMRVGGKLIDVDGTELSVVRRKRGKQKLHAADDKSPVDETLLQQMLGGIDEEAFHHRFGLSHDQLVAGGKAILDSKGELGEILFSAGAGVGQLKAIQSQLENECKELFASNARKPVLNVLLSELDEKRKKLRESQVMPAEYKQLVQRRVDFEGKAKRLAVEHVRCQRRREQLQGFRSAAGVVPIWRRQSQRLAELGDVAALDEDFAARRREALRDREDFEQRVAGMKADLAELERQLELTHVHPEIIDHEKEIVSLFQEIAARQAASTDQSVLKKRVHTLNRHLREHLKDLDIQLDDKATQQEIDEAIAKVHVSDATQASINELAGEYKRLREKEKDERQRVEMLRKRLADLDDELERTPMAGDPQMIDSVLSDIGAPDAMLAAAEQWKLECDELQSECRRLMVELGLADIELQDAVERRIASLAEVDDHDTAIAHCERNRDAAIAERQRLLDQQRDALSTLAQLHSEQTLPTEAELAEQRRLRDESIDAMESVAENAQEVRQRARSLKVQTREADLTVDTIRAHHQQVAQRATVQRELVLLEGKLTSAAQAVEESESVVRETHGRWQELWKACGIRAESPRQMRKWIATHQALCDKYDSLNQCRSKQDAAQSKIKRTARRLASILEIAMSAMPVTSVVGAESNDALGEMNLEALHDVAQQIKSELMDSARRLDDLKRRRKETVEELPNAESALAASEKQREQWDADWNQATESFSGQRDQSPSAISARLQKIAKIREEKRERDIVIGRIHSIDSDADAFTARVNSIHRLLSLDTATGVPVADLANQLHRRLQDAKLAAAEHLRLVGQRDGLTKKLEEVITGLDRANVQLRELCKEAGVTEIDELPAMEERSRDKQRAASELATAEKQLMMVAGSESLTAFAVEVESQDLESLDQELVELDAKLAQLVPEMESVQQELGVIKREIALVDGGDTAAELNQTIQFLSGRFDREAQKYARLKIAAMILQRAIDHYRSENESPVLKIACEAFRDLTCGRYSSLRAEYDNSGKSQLHGVQASQAAGDDSETLVAVEHMSLGTADALYLAMRLASLEHQLSGGKTVPVVIDDCLIQLDDERTSAALRRFSSLSLRTQVILFTHHEHLVQLAQDCLGPDEVHFHRIAG